MYIDLITSYINKIICEIIKYIMYNYIIKLISAGPNFSSVYNKTCFILTFNKVDYLKINFQPSSSGANSYDSANPLLQT